MILLWSARKKGNLMEYVEDKTYAFTWIRVGSVILLLK